ncbi:MAG: cupredoxin domain-containing protein [Dehalococcoidia bacterium]|nr:cupredoxin domain-containing protein [Dehalococcoidia bacterium]
MRRAVVLVLFGLLSLGVTACADDDSSSAPSAEAEVREVSVMMRDIAFEPTAIEVARGETVRLNFENGGALPHDFSIDSMPMGRMEMTGGMTSNGHGGHGSESAMHMALATGEHGMIEFEATEPGEYVFYCNEPGHRDAGMHGILRVS